MNNFKSSIAQVARAINVRNTALRASLIVNVIMAVVLTVRLCSGDITDHTNWVILAVLAVIVPIKGVAAYTEYRLLYHGEYDHETHQIITATARVLILVELILLTYVLM